MKEQEEEEEATEKPFNGSEIKILNFTSYNARRITAQTYMCNSVGVSPLIVDIGAHIHSSAASV